jgi:hypothetical protein
MASLLHDVGKPKVKGGDGVGLDVLSTRIHWRAHGGEGCSTACAIPREFVEQVAHLVRMHMFYYDTWRDLACGRAAFSWCASGRRTSTILLKVREADRIGSGVKKAMPYRLRHLLFMIEKVKRDPLSPKMLALRGDDLMPLLGLPQSRAWAGS